ncbi:MAG: hypothetical protein KKD44_01535, partial [Proteobacteria bacterium]|nr:hypothetical protein [Pseudomonadota bacterium]
DSLNNSPDFPKLKGIKKKHTYVFISELLCGFSYGCLGNNTLETAPAACHPWATTSDSTMISWAAPPASPSTAHP